MPAKAKNTTATIIPALRYRDAPAAIEWLCRAFGFEKHLVVPGEQGKIAHAQLTFGNGMIMLGSGHGGAYDRLIRNPSEIGPAVTQAPYIIVADPDDHYRQARAAGAEMIMDIADQEHGGRAYTCRDPEGHIWNFGDYDPWQDDGV
jgi:uncharacterized glyoxalase superfamily protein PhnB